MFLRMCACLRIVRNFCRLCCFVIFLFLLRTAPYNCRFTAMQSLKRMVSNQWHRSVVKYGLRVSQVKPSNCFRRLKKLFLPSISDKSLSSLMMWNLQLSNNSIEWKNVTFFRGQNILWPLLHISNWVKTPNPTGSAALFLIKLVTKVCNLQTQCRQCLLPRRVCFTWRLAVCLSVSRITEKMFTNFVLSFLRCDVWLARSG